jgi:glycine/D-amino acid oxidase-like deaminating enzyme/nitrite reductase/ring-hydroxylating ferredoxin subunit
VLLDDGPLAGGTTSVTTAHLSNAIDDRFTEIERWHGEKGAFLAAESHTVAIDRIEANVHELGIDCDFTRLCGYLFLAPGDDPGLLERELAAARRAGLPAEMVARAPLDFDTGPAIRFPNQARFHPLKYLAALAKAIQRGGGQIFTYSHADRIDGGPQAKVTVGPYTVRAGAVVVATNTPINDLVAIHTKQAPYMTYAIGARIPAGSVTDALYWDTLRAYHYVRLHRIRHGEADAPSDAISVTNMPGSLGNGQPPGTNLADGEYDLLIVGGEDHKSGQATDTVERHARLEAWARARFPMIDEVEFVWGGQVMETIDGLAFIGRNPLDADNVFIATGDSGMGITHGTIAGIVLTDLILGRQNRWASLYDPSRKTLRAAGNYAREALNMAGQYVVDWLSGGDVSAVDEIRPGQGAVLRHGLSKVAVYRDEDGKSHEMSAVCPHLGCIVHWNAAEHTWDCPCHGSRFDRMGKVFNGPANSDLSRMDNGGK